MLLVGGIVLWLSCSGFLTHWAQADFAARVLSTATLGLALILRITLSCGTKESPT
jgi:hypothetical protein